MRKQEEEILRERGISSKPRKGKLGGDINLWSRSIGSGQVEDLESQYPEDYIWTKSVEEAPNEPQVIELEFEKGVPVRVDDITDPIQVILHLNRVGGEHGVGRIDIIEDGMLGLKSRELYEAPAATILLKAHRDLECLTLDKEQLKVKRGLEQIWAYIVYHGMWFHPLRKDLDAFIDSTQQYVTGTIWVKLYKGNADIVKRSSKLSLFSPEIRSLKKTGFDQRDSIGVARILSLPYQIMSKREHQM